MPSVQTKEPSSWPRNNVSTDGVTQVTPSIGTHTQYPRPVKEQQGTVHNEEERILYTILGQALVTMGRDRFLLVSPFWEVLCTR